MSFEWHRTHKILEWVEREMTECVEQYVLEHYGLEEIHELTEEQISELETFRDEELQEYHPLQMGFSNIISYWENYEPEEDDDESGEGDE
jgi:hypothetical protein